MSISEILPEEKRRLHELELKLVDLERDNNVHASDIYIGLNDMILRLEELDKLVTREPKGKREDYKRRVLHLRNSHQHIKNSLDSIVKRKSHNQAKAELFLGADLEGGNGFEIESNLAESASLNRSSNMINNYLAIGQETLSSLMSQRDRLKGVQKKTLDMLNYLGISNSLMRSVERRDNVDKWIVYIGMILILLLVFYLLFWRKS